MTIHLNLKGENKNWTAIHKSRGGTEDGGKIKTVQKEERSEWAKEWKAQILEKINGWAKKRTT